MAKIYKTMRGEELDIDLFKIKSQMMKSEKPDAVVKREDFVKNKRRRNVKRRIDEILANQENTKQSLANKEATKEVTTNKEENAFIQEEAPKPQKRVIKKN